MARKESIKNTALSLFLQKGYAGTSIRDICKEEDIKTSTLYTYFVSKGSLLIEIMMDCQKKYFDAVDAYITETDFPGNTIERNFFKLFQMNLIFYKEYSREYLLLSRLALYRMTDVNEAILEKIVELRERINSVIIRILSTNSQTEAIKNFSIEEIEFSFFYFVQYYITAKKNNDNINEEDQMEKYWKFFWYGASSILSSNKGL